MKKASAIFLSAATITSAVSANVFVNDIHAEEMSDSPKSHFIVEPKTFFKDPKNTSGENVIKDPNLRKMINRSYGLDKLENGKRVSDQELRNMKVTKEMVENLQYLSPEQ